MNLSGSQAFPALRSYLMRLFLPIPAVVALLLSVPCVVRAQVSIHNTTNEAVTIVSQSWVTPTGRTVKKAYAWEFKPNQNSYLTVDGKALKATTFRWRIRTSLGETPKTGRHWVRTGAAGKCGIKISAGHLPKASGYLRIANTTAWKLKVHKVQVVDRKGVTHTIPGYWNLKPGAANFLLHDGKKIWAREATMSLTTGSHETRWKFTDSTKGDRQFTAKIGYGLVGPPTSWTGTLRSNRRASHMFATRRGVHTLVFRLQNVTRAGDVDIQVQDSKGVVVARSRYSGASDDRCMLHVTGQEQFKVVVTSSKATVNTKFRVSVRTISHLDVLGAVTVQEGGKAVLGGLLVELFGDKKDSKKYWNQTFKAAAKDVLALGIVGLLMNEQKRHPAVDPLSRKWSQIIRRVRGNDSRFVNIRRAFLDELNKRVRSACR